MPKEQDANGGVTLWVKKDAALQYKLAPAAQALANYFAGAIQAAQGAFGGAPAGAAVTVGACAAAASVNCTLRCATEITPCINTHAVPAAAPSRVGSPDAWLPLAGGAALPYARQCPMRCGRPYAALRRARPSGRFREFRCCVTDITPCINSHAITCYCPLTVGCRTQKQICDVARLQLYRLRCYGCVYN